MKKTLFKIFNIFFILSFTITLIGTIFVNRNSYFKASPILLLLSFSLISFILLLLFKKISNLKNISPKTEKIIYFLSFIIFTIIQIIIIKTTWFEKITWDFGTVFNAASECARGNYSRSELYYFFVFPNNIPILYFLTAVFKVCLLLGINNLVLVGSITNVIFIDISLLFLILSVRKIFGKKYGFICLILCFLMTPLLTYTNIFYTDTLSMPFPIIIFYIILHIDFNKYTKKNTIYLVLIGALAFIGFKAKFTVLFILIAYFIYILLKEKIKIKDIIKNFLLIIASFLICSLTYTLINNYIDAFTEENRLVDKIPYTHWIMMGTSETYMDTTSYNVNGIYNSKEYQNTNNYDTVEDKIKYNISVIKERIKSRKLIGNIRFFGNKLINTWGDGTYFASQKLNRFPENTNTLIDEILLPSGKYFKIYFYFASAIQLFIILMFIISGIYDIKNKEYNLINIVKISIFGILLFLLMWETRSRYLVNYIPLFILLTTYGVHSLFKTKSR